jgi:hypothetical protein
VHNPNKYYSLSVDPQYWSYNYRSNYTSDRFLCNVMGWQQGDWHDDAGLSKATGVGTDFGLDPGRHVRTNSPNITKVTESVWTLGKRARGEGIYECHNGGSCIAPDTCTCADGWGGYDCDTPLCRHRQADGSVSSCANGGVCTNRDDCHCIQTLSLLSTVHEFLPRGLTGWSGTDCSMPMCIQGYYDPFCTDLPQVRPSSSACHGHVFARRCSSSSWPPSIPTPPCPLSLRPHPPPPLQAPGNEGCYRCANGGNCTAPDVCTCAEGWTGYDCRTPVCEAVADVLTRKQLATSDEEKVMRMWMCVSLIEVKQPVFVGRS